MSNNTIDGELVYPPSCWVKETISQQEYTDWINNKSTTNQNKIISSILKVFEKTRTNERIVTKYKVLFICDSIDRIRNCDYSNLDSLKFYSEKIQILFVILLF